MRNTKDPIQAVRFYAFLRKTLGIYLKKSFRITRLNDNDFKPPYILLGNHVTSFDPFIMAIGIDHPINYVTSDSFFRSLFLRFFLNRLGCIPKTKFISDSITARAMINVKKKNGIIGIFPEGARSWDGHILPLVFSTAKLVKLLKIDVIGARLDGAMFTMPRWSRFRKKGPTFLSYFKILDSKQISELSIDEIYQKLSRSLFYDEYEFQRNHMHSYTGRRRAERLERFLYVCPSCSSFHSMHSKKDAFYCTSCSYSVIYDENGFFSGNNIIYDDTRSWNLFQHAKTLKLVSGSFKIQANHVFMFVGSKEFTKLRSLKLGTFYISDKSIYYVNLRKQSFKFDPMKIDGLNIQSNHKLEFYQDKVFYRLNFAKSNVSAYAAKKILSLLGKERVSENG